MKQETLKRTVRSKRKDVKLTMIPLVTNELVECMEDAIVVKRKGKMVVITVYDATEAEIKDRVDYWRDFGAEYESANMGGKRTAVAVQ